MATTAVISCVNCIPTAQLSSSGFSVIVGGKLGLVVDEDARLAGIRPDDAFVAALVRHEVRGWKSLETRAVVRLTPA